MTGRFILWTLKKKKLFLRISDSKTRNSVKYPNYIMTEKNYLIIRSIFSYKDQVGYVQEFLDDVKAA